MISFYKRYFGPDISVPQIILKELHYPLKEGEIVRINGSRELHKIVSIEFVGREYSWPGFDYTFKIHVQPHEFKNIEVDSQKAAEKNSLF